MPSSETSWALLRTVSRTLNRCSLQFQDRQPIDIPLAQQQHERYADTLRTLGLEVTILPELSDFPDACFVEDTAILFNDCAVICRIGTESRRGEETAIRQFLQAKGYRIVEMLAPATADGGDVLVIEKDVFIGLSARTNSQGAKIVSDAAVEAGFTPHCIEVVGGLHLKSVCTYAGGDLIVGFREKLGQGRDALDRFRMFEPPVEEVVAANVLRIANHVCVPARCEATRRAIERAGFVTIPLDVSELHKAEAGLTCLSILGSR